MARILIQRPPSPRRAFFTGFVSCGVPLAAVMIIKGFLAFGIAAVLQDFWVIVLIIFSGAFLGGAIFALPALVRLAAYAFLSRQ